MKVLKQINFYHNFLTSSDLQRSIKSFFLAWLQELNQANINQQLRPLVDNFHRRSSCYAYLMFFGDTSCKNLDSRAVYVDSPP